MISRNTTIASPQQRFVLRALTQGWVLRYTLAAAQLERHEEGNVAESQPITPDRVNRLRDKNWLTMLQDDRTPSNERGVTYFTISNLGKLVLSHATQSDKK